MRMRFLQPAFMSDGEALSIDEAVEVQLAKNDPAPEPEVVDTPAIEPDATVDAEVVDDGVEPEVDAEDPQDEPEVPAVEAPQWYDAEAKEVFAKLSPEMQAVVRAQEDKREAVTAKEKAAAIETRKQASEASEAMRGLIDKLQSSIPDEVAAFHARHNYDPQDLERYRLEDPAGYLALQAQIHAERTDLERKIAAKAEAERVAGETFAFEQGQRLREIAPELATPESIKALGDYLGKIGKAEAMKYADADELVIANKARLYDELQAKAAASANVPKPKPTPAKTVPPVRAQAAGTPQQRTVQQISNRLAQTGDLDDAVDLHIAQRAQKNGR